MGGSYSSKGLDMLFPLPRLRAFHAVVRTEGGGASWSSHLCAASCALGHFVCVRALGWFVGACACQVYSARCVAPSCLLKR